MKEILVDLYKVKDLYSGLGQFSINYARELVRQSPENFHFEFLTPGNINLGTGTNFSLAHAGFQKRYLPGFNKTYHIWHSLQQFPSHFPNKRTAFILTIHDLNFLIEKSEAKQAKYLKKLQSNCDRADVITAISYFVKQSIEKHINLRGKTIRVIYNGIEFDAEAEAVKPSFAGTKKFFFSVGIFTPKKNFHVLVPLMKNFPNHTLILAGNNDTPYGKQIRHQLHEMGLTDRVILPGRVTDSEKHWLYSNCEAFLFPSVAEGFGMPPIEAMKHGKPVFLSKHTSLPEIGGDAAFYFPNFEEKEMAEILSSRLKYFTDNEPSLSEQIKTHAQKFSWTNCASQYISLYNEIALGQTI